MARTAQAHGRTTKGTYYNERIVYRKHGDEDADRHKRRARKSIKMSKTRTHDKERTTSGSERRQEGDREKNIADIKPSIARLRDSPTRYRARNNHAPLDTSSGLKQ